MRKGRGEAWRSREGRGEAWRSRKGRGEAWRLREGRGEARLVGAKNCGGQHGEDLE